MSKVTEANMIKYITPLTLFCLAPHEIVTLTLPRAYGENHGEDPLPPCGRETGR